MRNKVKITLIAISRILKRKFIRFIFVLYFVNCVYLYHYMSKNSFIDKKTNIFLPIAKKILKNSRVSCTLAANITGYVDSYFNKKFHVVYRTFKPFYTACHLPMISQNLVDCNHNFENKNKKLLNIDDFTVR